MKVKPGISIFAFLLIWSASVYSQTLKILPLGNSLTQGTFCTNGSVNECESLSEGTTVGYRHALYDTLNAHGYIFDFVGNEISGYSVFPDFNHAGYPGFTTSELAAKMNENGNYLMNSTSPDIVLLEIGTNDVYGNSTSVTHVNTILNEIDEYESGSGDDVIVFLSKIIRFTEGTTHESLVGTFNTNLLNLFNTRKNAGDLIEWVDIGADLINKMEPLGDMKDELHPNQEGYTMLANRWFLAIDGYNKRPVLTQIPDKNANEGSSFEIISLDSYVQDVEDADAIITWNLLSVPGHFNVTINENRQLIVTPLDPDWNGTESITLSATDNGKVITSLRKSETMSVSFTVNPVNDAPVIISQLRIPFAMEESSVGISIADLEIQDIDNDISELSIQVLSGSNYTFTNNVVMPSNNFNGELLVNIRVKDTQSYSQPFVMKINVTPRNDPPVIISGSAVSFNEDTQHEIKLTDLQVTDPDNFYPADFSLIIGNGQHYTVSGNVITPEYNFNGTLAVPVKVKDKLEMSNEYIYTLTLLPVNDPPYILIPSNRTANENDYFEIALEAGDIDETDEPLLSAVSLPGWLSFDQISKKIQGTLTQQFLVDSIVKIRVNDSHVIIDSTFYIKLNPISATDEIGGSNDFRVYPNPVSEYIHISHNENTSSQIVFKLFNSYGVQMLVKEILSGHTLIFINESELQQGLYFYEISDNGYIRSRGKLIIQ